MNEDVVAALFPAQAPLARGDVALRVLLELGRVEKADVLDAYEVFDRLSGGMKELDSEAAVRAARGLGSSEV